MTQEYYRRRLSKGYARIEYGGPAPEVFAGAATGAGLGALIGYLIAGTIGAIVGGALGGAVGGGIGASTQEQKSRS